MARGRKKGKKAINQLVEHIADYSDIEYDDENADDVISMQLQNKNDKKCEDETDRMWMYKDIPCEDIRDDEEITDEDLWDEQDKCPVEISKNVKSTPVYMDDKEKYMAAAVWFHEISERGFMTESEKRYVTLMLIEMSKFYFDNIKDIKPSGKCLEAIKRIYRDIQEAEVCSG